MFPSRGFEAVALITTVDFRGAREPLAGATVVILEPCFVPLLADALEMPWFLVVGRYRN